MPSVFSVAEFIGNVNDIIAGEFVIEGEISQYKVSQGKWIFFDLKDDRATLNCFSTIFMLPAPLEDGMRVQVLGYPKVQEKSGRFSFTVQKVVPIGAGALQRAYTLLKEKLTTEGLFSVGRKRSLPGLPSRIGVIASRESAAFGDFSKIINGRWGGLEIIVRQVTVQGETAVDEIVGAFQEFNSLPELCDVVVLIRGGGSLEDLAAFNSEAVVRAVYGSRSPVVTGVGHERDETLVDFAADVRAATPTHAAQLIVPDRKEFLANLEMQLVHVGDTLEHTVRHTKHSVDEQVNVFNRFFDRCIQQGRFVVERCAAIPRLLQALLERRRLAIAHAQLQNVLAGYTDQKSD
jgi:exodeoxyribonuclease VII large subunit